MAFGKAQARAARRDAFSVFFSQAALPRLTVRIPGRAITASCKLLATNAVVFSLVQQLDAPDEGRGQRAPAVLAVSDQLDRSACSASPRRFRPPRRVR